MGTVRSARVNCAGSIGLQQEARTVGRGRGCTRPPLSVQQWRYEAS
jgi:hypothetical protein